MSGIAKELRGEMGRMLVSQVVLLDAAEEIERLTVENENLTREVESLRRLTERLMSED